MLPRGQESVGGRMIYFAEMFVTETLPSIE